MRALKIIMRLSEMDISVALERFRARATPSEMVSVFDPDTLAESTKTVYKSYLKKLSSIFESQDTHESVALTLALLQAKRGQAVWDMREKGFFRISRYDFDESACTAVDVLIMAGRNGNLETEALEYLLSVQALHSLRSQIKPIYSYIAGEVERFRGTILKSIFVVIDRMFLGQWNGGDKNLPSDHPLHHSMEDFAEAFSTIVGIFKKRFGVTLSDWQRADPDRLNSSNTYIFILTAAAQLNAFKQAEVMLDGLPYGARLVENKVHIFSKDPLFEKTIRLGYVQQEKQSIIRVQKTAELHHSSELKMPSLIEEAKKLYDAGLKKFIYVMEEPVRRLVFAIPHSVVGIIGYKGVFIEEFLSIMRLDVDDFSDDDPLAREIKPGINIRHLLHAQRLFSFVACMYELALEEMPEDERKFITAQSAINIIPRKGVVKSLSLGMPEEVAEEVVSMLSLPAEGDLIDIQYFPFIPAGDDIVFSSRVLSASNIARNIYVSNRLYKGWPIGRDPMIIKLRASLLEAGFLVEMEVDLPFGKDLDADILAYKDGMLLFLECKHVYHPCNMHEMRNTLWHVEKGGIQLKARIPLLSDKKNLDSLLLQVGWTGIEVDDVRGSIITSTRVLHGWKAHGYPVVQANEFINVLVRGFIAGPEGNYHFWEGDKLAVRDISLYLDGVTIIDDQLSSMKSRLEVHPYGTSKLIYETWSIYEEGFADKLTQKYRFTRRPAD
ncbi:hypothetical protein ALQ78_01300 [Pseudomonas syringae pv. aptata]|nr:hypothetical protein ALQ78_01300 [Pseudomonas syringae pv. aptata]